MAHYVYILKSLKDGTYYKRYSPDYKARFEVHNRGDVFYTKRKAPWELFYVEVHADKKSALIREKKLKKCKKDYFEWLQKQPGNILNSTD
jgi:putative endonuclease